MSQSPKTLTRRSALKNTAALCAVAAVESAAMPAKSENAKPTDIREQLQKKVQETLLVDTHEHLLEEEERLKGDSNRIKANDWSLLLSHYLDSDLLTAGMPKDAHDALFSTAVDPVKKWEYLEPYWPAVRHTGYGQAVEIALRELYGVEGLSRETVSKIQEGYRRRIRPGFYREILHDTAGIESCQVNCLASPFSETMQPTLLMQDISFLGMHMGPNLSAYAPKAGIEVKNLNDWHSVIDWWFKKYGPYAVAIKSQAAYSRNLDFEDVPAETASPSLKKKLAGENLTPEESKRLEDHLFWYCVRKATEYHLPVKLHTGYYAGQNSMPLARLQGNPGAITDLCKKAPDATFIFMHICYPYYEELIAAVKQHTNAVADMCWAWIISPVAGVNFLKQFLVTAPANKVLTFGGDYIPVEPVVGHAAIARKGIVNALSQLTAEGWLTPDAALELVEPIMRGNARRIFNLEEKTKKLATAPWVK